MRSGLILRMKSPERGGPGCTEDERKAYLDNCFHTEGIQSAPGPVGRVKYGEFEGGRL